MKFLCVPCDEPMQLIKTQPPDRGSLVLTYECKCCGYKMAMLTNPYETEVVGSLGVKVSAQPSSEGSTKDSKCPFSDMIKEMETEADSPTGSMDWTSQALERLQNIPEFVRPMAKSGIERFAKDNDCSQIDVKVLDEAKEFFGM